jgi:hypothetical protein
MPTGYTAAVKDGITFEQFVMRCSRAMGATIDMRDEPLGAPIPEAFEPSQYDVERINEDRKELARIHSLTSEQAEAEAHASYVDAIKRNQKYIEKANNLREKYQALLDQVALWQPPTSEHEGLKKFMADQLEESIRFDCNIDYYVNHRPSRLTGEEWRSAEVLRLLESIKRREKDHAEELQRTADRNAWLKALRESLKPAS